MKSGRKPTFLTSETATLKGNSGEAMYFKQFYLACLAHASYLIGSAGEGVVVDPQRDVDLYIADAEAQGLKIKYVIETHLHADFVSGHRELAERTGAEIVIGAKAGATFPHRGVRDGDEITIGKIKKTNSALKLLAKVDLVRMMTADLPEAPAYFPQDAEINRGGAHALAEVSRPTALAPQKVNALVTHGHVILDVRSAREFGAGHVPGSLNIGLGGQFASWAGILIPMGTPIVIVAETDEEVDEAVMRLARVGIESVKGYLRGGIDAWREAGLGMSNMTQITVGDLRKLIEKEAELQGLDVRRPPEYEGGHVPHALHAPLLNLQSTIPHLTLDPAKPTAVICAGGYRSSAAASILKQHGFRKLLNVTGGTGAWIDAGYPVEKP